MSQKIIRFYNAVESAAKAAKDLADEGFADVFQFKSAGGKGAAAVKSREVLLAEMLAAQVYHGHAETYVERLAKGGAMVLVHAPFGSSVNAARIMDLHGASGMGLDEGPTKPDYVWDERAPLSSALMLPVLTDVKLPMETLTGVTSLSSGTAFLSDLLGIPLLSRGSAHSNASFGMPLLSQSATPLSSMLGMPVLSRNATPLSSMLGLSVLKR
jgi:hypothetical protein